MADSSPKSGGRFKALCWYTVLLTVLAANGAIGYYYYHSKKQFIQNPVPVDNGLRAIISLTDGKVEVSGLNRDMKLSPPIVKKTTPTETAETEEHSEKKEEHADADKEDAAKKEDHADASSSDHDDRKKSTSTSSGQKKGSGTGNSGNKAGASSDKKGSGAHKEGSPKDHADKKETTPGEHAAGTPPEGTEPPAHPDEATATATPTDPAATPKEEAVEHTDTMATATAATSPPPAAPTATGQEPAPATTTEATQTPPAATPAADTATAPAAQKPGAIGKMSIIITGLGLSTRNTEIALSTLPQTVTLGFSPYASKLSDWTEQANTKGYKVLLGLPMEPKDFPVSDPGPLAMLVQNTPEKNKELLDWITSQAPKFEGLYTPQDERFTSVQTAAYPVLKSIKEKGLMVVYSGDDETKFLSQYASSIELPVMDVDLVLDDTITPEYIFDQLLKAEQLAREKGHVVVIGHSYPVTMEKIREWLAQSSQKDILVVPITELTPKSKS